MKVGNFVIVGHNYRDGQFFGKLKELTNGDNVFFYAIDGSALMYTVYNKYIIDEYDLSCLSQNTDGNTELTLITCDNDNTKRLIVKCRAVNS